MKVFGQPDPELADSDYLKFTYQSMENGHI